VSFGAILAGVASASGAIGEELRVELSPSFMCDFSMIGSGGRSRVWGTIFALLAGLYDVFKSCLVIASVQLLTWSTRRLEVDIYLCSGSGSGRWPMAPILDVSHPFCVALDLP
jgi:hypothetical protein